MYFPQCIFFQKVHRKLFVICILLALKNAKDMLDVRWFSLCFSRLGDLKREISAKHV